MIVFELCQYHKIKEQMERYYNENDILVDSFWEDHVRKSTYYLIKECDAVIGFLSIFEKQLMTSFHIYKTKTDLAQEALRQAKQLEAVQFAFAPTGDEQLISLCLDGFKYMEIQAYFTKDLGKQKSEGIKVRVATKNDYELVKSYSDDFFEDIQGGIEKGQIYIGYKEEEVIGFGDYEVGFVRKDMISVGMFVREEFRRQGIGKNLLCAMKEVVRSQGKTAISGCWYYNHNSIKTQFASGNTCSSRLLKFHF